jgi:antitoxin (DNA-binding transcriptional repressor) of toxin-antitoxin stability system
MNTATVEDVQARLPELLDDLGPGDELLIMREGRPVGRLLPATAPSGVPVFGRGKGKVTSYVDDDDHLRDWAEYMP